MPAAYGGNDLSQANTVYLDSHWGIGASVRELVQGVDCPMTAAYIDAVTFFKGASKPNLHKNAICVFEHNPGSPPLPPSVASFSWRSTGSACAVPSNGNVQSRGTEGLC
jgi:hypothetical protein